MPKRKTRSCHWTEPDNCDSKIGSETTEHDQGVSRTRARRRLLSLNKIPDKRLNSSSDVKSCSKELSFVATRLKSIQKNIENSSNNCHETKISKRRNSNNVTNINSRCEILSVDARQNEKQCNGNVNVTNNSVPLNLGNNPKDKTECNNAEDNGSNTSCSNSNTIQVRASPPIEKLNNIDSHYSHCHSHMIELPDSTLVCGGGQENLTCQELGCEDELEPVICTQDLSFGATSNDDDLSSEIQWDCQSPELVRDVKQLQGLYGMDEVRDIVSNFSDADVELQKHAISELQLYLPVKRDHFLARKSKHQKAKVRAGMRPQRKVYGRESAEAILKWLLNKAAVHLPDGALENTAALETLETLPVCSYMTPSVSPELDDFNMNITDDASQIPFEVDETGICLSSRTITACAAVPSIIGAQVLDLSQDKTLKQIQTLSNTDAVCEKVLPVVEVFGSQDSAVSTLWSAPLRKTVSVEAAMNSLHVQPAITPSISTETEDGVFSDDDDDFLQGVDETLDSRYSTVSTSSSTAPSRKPACMEVALNSLHVQTALSPSVSAIEDGAFSDDDDDFLQGVDETLDNHYSTVSTSSSAAPRKPTSEEATVNSLHVQSAITPRISTETEDGVFSDDDDGFLQGVDETLDSRYSTVSTSSSAAPRKPASGEATMNSFLVHSAITPSISPAEDDAFSDDDNFLLEVNETLDSHYGTVSTFPLAVPMKPASVEATLNSLSIQSALTPNVSAAEDGAFSDDDDDLLLEVDETLDSHCNNLFTSVSPSRTPASVETAMNSLHLQSTITPSISTETEDGVFSDNDDDFLQGVDETLDSCYSTVSTSSSAAPRKITSMEATMNSLHVQTALSPSVSAIEDGAFSDGDDFLLEVETLDCHCNTLFTSSSAPLKKAASLEATMQSLHVQPAFIPSLSTTEHGAMDFSISDDVFQRLLEVDQTSDSQASTIIALSSAPSKKSASVEAALSFNYLQSVITSSVSAKEDGAFNDSISDDDDFLLKVDQTSDSQASTVFTSSSAPPRTPVSVEVALNSFPAEPTTALCLSASADGSFKVISDETLDYQTGIVPTSKSTTFESLKKLHPNSDVTRGSSATSDNFNVSICVDECDILQDDDKTLDYRSGSILSGSIFTSMLGLSKETTGVVATLNPLYVQSHITPGVSPTEDDGFDVSVSDDDLLLEVETLDRQTSAVTTLSSVEATLKPLYVQSHVTADVSTTDDDGFDVSVSDDDLLIEFEDILNRQAYSISSSEAGISEKTAPVCSMELQLESDNVSGKKDFDVIIPDDGSQLLLDDEETLDSRAKKISTSGAISLQTTSTVETLLRTQQRQRSDLIVRVSTTQDEFSCSPGDDFEQMIEVGDSLGSQISILSSSTVDFCEKTAEVETSKTLQKQSDLIYHGVPMTTGDTDFPDYDFDQMIEVGDSLDSQISIVSSSTVDFCEKTAEVKTLKTLHKQSDLIYHSASMTTGDTDFPDDFEQMIEVGDSLDSQISILSSSTVDFCEKTAEVETLKTLQKQSDLIHGVPMSTDDTDFPDDGFHQMVEVGESLGNQTDIPSISIPSNLYEITAEVETLKTLPIKSDVIQNISVIQVEDVSFSDDFFEYLQEVGETLSSQTNILSTSALSDLREKTAAAETLPIESDMIQNISMTQDEFINFPDEDLIEVNEILASQANSLSPSPASASDVRHRPVLSLYKETTQEYRTFDSCQIQKPSPLNNDGIKKYLNETLRNQPANIPTSVTLHSQDSRIATSMTAIPGVALAPMSDNWKISLSDTSLKTLQMQSSVRMNISKSTDITDCGSNRGADIRKSTNHGADISQSTNHSAVTSDSKQFSLSKLTEHLSSSSSSSSRAVNSTPANVKSPRGFKFKRVTPLQMNSLPCVNMQSPFIPHLSNISPGVKWSNSNNCSSDEGILHQAETAACSQARCSPEEIEQKRQAALQKRSLRPS